MENGFQPKVGQLFCRVNKGGHPEHVRVELGEEELRVSRHDMVYEDVLATKDIVDRRRVLLQKSEDGLGIAIVGGIDFKLPVSVDIVFDNTPASRSEQIKKGDVVLEVNGTSIWGKTHEETVSVLKAAGQVVTIEVATLQEKEEEGVEGAPGDHWIPYSTIPLRLATVSQYIHGTATLRPNTFQVVGCDERSKVTLYCDEHKRGQLEEWLAAIGEREAWLLREEMEKLNSELEESEQAIKMGWVHELLSSTLHSKVWKRKFIVLRKSALQIFDTYPTDQHEWLRPVHVHQLTEITTRVLKPHEIESQRAHSIILTSGKGYTHIMSFESLSRVHEWTRAIHNQTLDTMREVEKLQFSGQWRNQDIFFCLELNEGFVVRDHNMIVKWKKPFSQLRSSSDDSHSWLRLEFSRPRSQHTETQELELENLHLAVIAMECFLVTKVATADPDYIRQTDIIAQPPP